MVIFDADLIDHMKFLQSECCPHVNLIQYLRKKTFPQLKSISRIISLFFREYSGNNDATSVTSRIRRIRKRIMVLSAGIYGASQSWTANPESGFLLRYCQLREGNECGAYWSNTSVCQKYTVIPGSQSLFDNSHYSSSSGFQSSNNSSESHKLNDHSKFRNFDKLLRAHIQDQFTLCKKYGSAHLFRKTCI